MTATYQAHDTEFVGLIVRDGSGQERVYRVDNRRREIRRPEEVVLYTAMAVPELATDREHFVVIGLDAHWRPTGHRIVSVGTLESSLVHPREVFRALLDIGSVSAFIAAHNHPSGNPSPSPEDRQLTRRLKEASVLMGIRMTDHVIVTATGAFYSFRAEEST